MNRPFIVGAVVGLDYAEVQKLYSVAEQELREAGLDPINPTDRELEADLTFLQYMRISLRELLDADGVAYLPSANNSADGQVLLRLARDIGMPVGNLDLWTVTQGDF